MKTFFPGISQLPLQCTLICTIKNEESTIKDFLSSIYMQKALPDEVIIVDGGSEDSTVDIINSISLQDPPLFLIKKKDINIAQGRNIAIQQAKYPIIACSDAGCRVDENWLCELLSPFSEKPSIKVIGGWYQPDAVNNFQRIVSSLIFPRVPRSDKDLKNFLPSGRNMAFYKKCWDDVGGFPEDLETAEDTVFDLNLKRAGYSILFQEKALVYWKVRNSLNLLYKQFRGYARGDGKAHLFTRNYLKTICFYSIGYLCIALSIIFPSLILIPILGFPTYVIVHVKLKKVPLKYREALLIPIIILIVDFGRMTGYLEGSQLRSLRKFTL